MNMKKHFITGLVILLPLAVTIAVLIFLVNFFTKPFIGIVSKFICEVPWLQHGFFFLSQTQIIEYTSRIIILILLFLSTVGLGILARWFFMNAFLGVCDKILHRIPIVNTVYKTSQDIIKTIFVSDKNSFKQVVMVPFPRPGVFVLGLIARESPPACSRATQTDLISVLVPTTPNPTTGFLLMFKKEDIIFVDIKPEDAIKYIVSCGVIVPDDPNPIQNHSVRSSG
jgi:uncharacterized membrane protein